MLNLRLKQLARADFARREDGSVAIETVILLPLLFWTFLSLYSLFDAFRQYTLNQKAAYTIGDMISRETAGVDNDYVDGTRELFDYMTRSDHASSIRITQIQWDQQRNRYKRDWSKTRGWVRSLSNRDIRHWGDKLPLMPDAERVIIVETWSKYDPPFSTGLEAREITNFVFTRPRYAPCVAWTRNDGTTTGC